MDIYDNLKLASYVAAAEAFDNSQNIFYSFLPMVEPLLLLSEDKATISFLALQKSIDDTYGVSIPKSTLRYLIEMLEKEGKVRFVGGNTIIPTREKIYLEMSQRETDKNNIEDLFLDFQSYLVNNGYAVSVAEIRSKICTWIYWHSCDLAEFIDLGTLSAQSSKMDKEDDWEYSDLLFRYLVESKKTHTSAYSAFLRLYDGAVQASLLNFSPKEIKDVADSNLSFENVILDTNFILRLLNLQDTIDNETAVATWNALRNSNAKFWVLEQTIHEASQSIKSFINEIAPYSQQTRQFLSQSRIHTTGFLSAYRHGVSRTSFFEYSRENTLQDILREKYDVNIIEEYNADIPLEFVNDLIRSKNSDRYGVPQAKHDLLLIFYCRKQRVKRIKSFSDVKWWILTNDKKLTYWNQENCGEYQECITEVQLSNVLWLRTKKDNSDGLINTIVALAAKSALSFIEISQFAKKIEKYKLEKSDDVSTLDNIALVFASDSISSDDIRNINDDDSFANLIEAKIEEAKKKQEEREREFSEAKDSIDAKEKELSKARCSLEKKDAEIIKLTKVNMLIVKREALKKDIDDREKEIVNAVNEGKQLYDIRDFCDNSIKIIRRITGIKLFFLCAVFLVFVIKFMFPFFNAMGLSNDIPWIFISSGFFLIIVTGIYYFITLCLMGELVKPLDFFERYCEKALAKKRKKYVVTNKYKIEFAKGNIDFLLSATKKVENEGRTKLQELQQELSDIQEELDRLGVFS